MARQEFRIDSISGGWSRSLYEPQKGQYLASIGIDPDLPLTVSSVRTSGGIIPSIYTKFSGTEFTGSPKWIITNPKTTDTYIYASDGKLHSFNSSIAMRSTDAAGTALPISISGGAGNGAIYYNNFLYLFEGDNISQYGGLDQGASVAKTENVWTGAKFGMSALTDYIYPSTRAGVIPNHPAHLHVDGAVYFGDSSSTNRKGLIHKLKTTRTTIDGDTNDGSAYNVLDLPVGFFPTDIESYGNDLVISAIQISESLSGSNQVNQGRAALFFWDTISDSFYNQVPLPDPLCTALLNNNGQLFVFSGNAQSGARVSRYAGGQSLEQVAYLDEGVSPLAGAIDAFGSRISFGGYTSYPETSASVFSIGSKTGYNTRALHNTARTSSTGSSPGVSALKYVQQANNAAPRLIIGWFDGSGRGLDYYTTGNPVTDAVWNSPVFTIGKKFTIERIQFPLTQTADSGTNITPTIYVDDERSSFALTAISDATHPSKRTIVYKNPKNSSGAEVRGEYNFYLRLKWTSSTYVGVSFPIIITAQVYDDETDT